MFRIPASVCRLGLLAVVCLGTAHAQPATPPASLDLASLLAEAVATHPALQAERYRTEGLSTRRRQVTAWPDPKIVAMYQPLPLYTARGAQRSQWRVEQTIPNRRTLRLQGEVADFATAIAEQETAAFGDALVLQIQQAYYELYRVQELDRLIREFQQELDAFAEATAVRRYRREGRLTALPQLHANLEERAVDRVRPKLMTVFTIILGLPPIMLGTGAEVMQRIAAPMVGGLVSSTVLLPAAYLLIQRAQLRRAAPSAPNLQRTEQP